MKVFISWSGIRAQQVATILRRLLPCMIQGLDVFLSRHDMESGARWGDQLATELESSSFGIICLTVDNQHAPWILFEAGALTKLLDGRACGLLIDGLTPANVSGPLSQFQHRRMTSADFQLLLRDLNARLTPPLQQDQLRMVFDKWWPDLEQAYNDVLATPHDTTTPTPPRPERDILEEILERVRRHPVLGPSPAEKQLARICHRVVASLSSDQLALLHRISALRDRNDEAAVSAALQKQSTDADHLYSIGLLYPDDQGTPRMNRYLVEQILPAFIKST